MRTPVLQLQTKKFLYATSTLILTNGSTGSFLLFCLKVGLAHSAQITHAIKRHCRVGLLAKSQALRSEKTPVGSPRQIKKSVYGVFARGIDMILLASTSSNCQLSSTSLLEIYPWWTKHVGLLAYIC
nr:unnamed protein product [Gossypium raimondii]